MLSYSNALIFLLLLKNIWILSFPVSNEQNLFTSFVIMQDEIIY